MTKWLRTVLMPLALTTVAAAPTSPLTDQQRIEAITDAYGLGCAVQDRDIDRAAAWASAAMGAVVALESKASHEAANDFSGYFYSAERSARGKGGFNCEGVPKLPPK